MKTLNVVFIISLGILVSLILYKSLGHQHFRNNAEKWSARSIDQSNLLSTKALDNIKGNKLIISLDTKSAMDHSISIAPDKILDKENLKRIYQFDGPVILYSMKPAESARVWMILSQLGIKNLYILTT